MRFIIQVSSASGRVGKLTNFQRLSEVELETPALFMHTRGGNIPHITHDVLQMITKNPLVMQMPITTLMKHVDSIREFDGGIAQFVGLQEYPSYITPQDPALLTPVGYNMSNSVALWAKTGRIDVTAQRYMTAIEVLKPDMYLVLSDGDTNSRSSAKRVKKSLDRSLQMFKDCLEHHNSSQVLGNSAILAAVGGGYDLNARKEFLKEVATQPVCGFVIEGLHNNGPEAEDLSFDEIQHIVSESFQSLPPEKLRVMHGAWNPITLLQLIAEGCDIFDASLAFLSTERNAALCFPYKTEVLSEEGPCGPHVAPDIDKDRRCYELYLEDDRYKEDFQPLLKGCLCLACRQHTRAYVHHLLKTKELLGKVLLMIHNLHHYLDFFKEIRKAVQNESLQSILNIVTKYCQK